MNWICIDEYFDLKRAPLTFHHKLDWVRLLKFNLASIIEVQGIAVVVVAVLTAEEDREKKADHGGRRGTCIWYRTRFKSG